MKHNYIVESRPVDHVSAVNLFTKATNEGWTLVASIPTKFCGTLLVFDAVEPEPIKQPAPKDEKLTNSQKSKETTIRLIAWVLAYQHYVTKQLPYPRTYADSHFHIYLDWAEVLYNQLMPSMKEEGATQ